MEYPISDFIHRVTQRALCISKSGPPASIKREERKKLGSLERLDEIGARKVVNKDDIIEALKFSGIKFFGS